MPTGYIEIALPYSIHKKSQTAYFKFNSNKIFDSIYKKRFKSNFDLINLIPKYCRIHFFMAFLSVPSTTNEFAKS